jgi:DNA-binding transcriptional MerR regulator
MIKLLNIADLAKKLNLINHKTKKPLNYILRYWEKEFKQVKPTKIRNRRYYSQKQVETIKLIKFLLKDKGMTINGVKNVLKTKINSLDDYDSYSLKADYLKDNLKSKSKTLLEKVKKLKIYGKKNSPKS